MFDSSLLLFTLTLTENTRILGTKTVTRYTDSMSSVVQPLPKYELSKDL